ncbi:MAG: hypothetical protein SH857_13860 [Chitinophagales bacterium]|mgnify:CR=1 FL=1|nr:hypothetical protein [Chitinophagales bacterium]
MKKIITIVIISALSGWAFSQTGLGVDKATTSQKLDVNGWLEVGNESAPGTGSAGTIRYNSSVKSLQFHNGSTWVNVGITTNFTNWGRNDCPATSQLVYTGYAAGGNIGHTGSGANTLCLTNAPIYAAFSTANQDGNLLYGVEMLTSGYGLATLAGFHGYDMLCAVCEATGNEALMMPGTTNCPSGWIRQYSGYVMSAHYTQRKGEFVCVNASPVAYGSNVNTGGDYWYPTETELGSLTAPYVHDREVTCCICTR